MDEREAAPSPTVRCAPWPAGRSSARAGARGLRAILEEPRCSTLMYELPSRDDVEECVTTSKGAEPLSSSSAKRSVVNPLRNEPQPLRRCLPAPIPASGREHPSRTPFRARAKDAWACGRSCQALPRVHGKPASLWERLGPRGAWLTPRLPKQPGTGKLEAADPRPERNCGADGEGEAAMAIYRNDDGDSVEGDDDGRPTTDGVPCFRCATSSSFRTWWCRSSWAARRASNALEEACPTPTRDILLLAAQKRGRPGRPGRGRHLRDRHPRHHHPAAAPARRHREGARRGQEAREDQALRPETTRTSPAAVEVLEEA